jgi:hypothetical protein
MITFMAGFMTGVASVFVFALCMYRASVEGK